MIYKVFRLEKLDSSILAFGLKHGLRFCGVRCCSTQAGQDDKFKLFFNNNVQYLLWKLTRRDLSKVFKKRKDGSTLEKPVYKFMTTADLEKAKAEAEIKARNKLQIPPALPPRKEINEVLTKDERLVGYSASKFVFTDISMRANDKNRYIVVRDSDGTLRKATWGEREKMNCIYFPKPGRHQTPPAMFEDEYLKSLLDREEYEFILDAACAQFEPDDSRFIELSETVFDKINAEKSFNVLRSTRHFGSMVFYLVRTKQIDNLLIENMETDRLEDADWLLDLYSIIHPDANSSKASGNPFQRLQDFISQDAVQKDELQLVLQSYKEFLTSPKSQQLQT